METAPSLITAITIALQMRYNAGRVLKSTGDVSETNRDNEVIPNRSVCRQRTGAARIARWRDRRQRGFSVYQIEVCDADIDHLIRRCLLDRQDRNDHAKVERAIGLWLDQLGR
jgi:hypothetical protein